MLFKVYKNEHEVERFLNVDEYYMESVLVEKDNGILGLDIMLSPFSVYTERSVYLGFVPMNSIAEYCRIATDPETGKFDTDMCNLLEGEIRMLEEYILQYISLNYTVELVDELNRPESQVLEDLKEYVYKKIRV